MGEVHDTLNSLLMSRSSRFLIMKISKFFGNSAEFQTECLAGGAPAPPRPPPTPPRTGKKRRAAAAETSEIGAEKRRGKWRRIPVGIWKSIRQRYYFSPARLQLLPGVIHLRRKYKQCTSIVQILMIFKLFENVLHRFKQTLTQTHERRRRNFS